ncbi:MAG: helix-turn-helix domain-containing protein [Acholeplasmataceae bacterium]|nr:helix-turn-helix domain-containing protein [Acholeplasmataceae bacterium]
MIGDKIKSLRVQHQLTQEQLGEKLFVTRNAISKWETNKGTPNIESLKQLASLFNVSLDDLLGQDDLVTMTLLTHQRMIINTNLIQAIVLFITFAAIGILIPYYAFNMDPTSGIAVFVILLPFSYVLLGIMSIIMSAPWPFVVLSSALALIPVYVFFDTVMFTILGYWMIIYWGLFIGTHLLVQALAKKGGFLMSPSRLKHLFFWMSIGLSVLYVIHTTYEAVSLYRCEFCSAPWYTVVVINTLLYLIPVTLSYALFLYYRNKNRHTTRPE